MQIQLRPISIRWSLNAEAVQALAARDDEPVSEDARASRKRAQRLATHRSQLSHAAISELKSKQAVVPHVTEQ